jgi:glutamyl-tRNA reductase
MAQRVAALGIGIMGAPMARNLLKAGFQIRVWNRTPDKARVLAAEGADLAESPADAVREAAFVMGALGGSRPLTAGSHRKRSRAALVVGRSERAGLGPSQARGPLWTRIA